MPTTTNNQTSQGDRVVVLRNIHWETYKQLAADLGETRGTRLMFYQGELEIMSPSVKHEQLAWLLGQIILTTARHNRQRIVSCGSMTIERNDTVGAAEPDASFYIGNEAKVRGKTEFDLTTDPPPDLIVEIDVTSGSRMKFSIYHMFGIPEIWHFDERKGVTIFSRTKEGYELAETSLAFPVVTTDILRQCVQEFFAQGQFAAWELFSDWIVNPSK